MSFASPSSVAKYAAAVCLLVAGCSNSNDISSRYGDSVGAAGRTSLNGFGALRGSFEKAGFDTRQLHRLTNRSMNSDVIVLLPTSDFSLPMPVTNWIEKWLARRDRTLVYILPDSGCEHQYWSDATKIAPAKLRLEYRRRRARSLIQSSQWRLNRRNIAGSGWFTAKPKAAEVEIRNLSGPWSQDLKDASASVDAVLETEYELVAAETPATPNSTASGVAVGGPTGPSSPSYPMFAENYAPNQDTKMAPLLRLPNQSQVVGRITSAQWPNSQIIVVSGGSLLANYAFTDPVRRRLADNVINACRVANGNAKAGFMTVSNPNIPISEVQSSAPKSAGMELLMVWPISLITIHAAILGLVLCIVILPIFGRPKILKKKHSTSFGNHLDAVAALMLKTGDEEFAKQRISDYFRRVRGENKGPWVQPVAAKTETDDAADTQLTEAQPTAPSELNEGKLE